MVPDNPKRAALVANPLFLKELQNLAGVAKGLDVTEFGTVKLLDLLARDQDKGGAEVAAK